jgi:hypothetical protein
MTKYLAAILVAFILMASGCRRDRGRSQREAAPASVPAASTVQKTVIIPDNGANKTPDESNSSTTAPLPEMPGPAVSVTIVTATTALAGPAGLSSSPAAHKTKKVTRSNSSGRLETKANTPGANTPARTRRVYEDPRLILAGMSYREVVRRFGPASLTAIAVPDSSILSYSRRSHHVQVELKNGIVVGVTGTGSP